MAATRTHKITLIPGDGIGPEVTAATVSIVEAAGQATGCSFEWERHDAGADAFANGVRAERRAEDRGNAEHTGNQALDVRTLGLNTPDYLPEVHYHQVRDAWHGLRTPSGQ